MAFGFDFGLDVTAVSLPADFQTALATASNQNSSSNPRFFSRFRNSAFTKAFLTESISVSAELLTGTSFDLYGGDVKWAFLREKAGTLAIRQTISYAKLFYFSAHTYDTQVLVSKNLLFIDPYFGLGYLVWNGDISGNGLPAGVDGSRSGGNPHIFMGVPLKLMALRIIAEYDYNFAGLNSYGMRIGFGI